MTRPLHPCHNPEVLNLKPFYGIGDRALRAPVSRINIWDGSVRSGKTINSLVRWARWARFEAPAGGLMMVSKTERTARQNIVDPLIDIFGERSVRYSPGNHELWLFGRRHMIVGASDARAEGKIRGITLAGMYGDEVTLWPESFFSMALSRLSVPGATLFGTTNPDSPVHWLKRKYLDRAGELGLARWQFRLEDNYHLDPVYVEALKREYTGLWYKRYILGEWAVAEGAIYDALNEDVHLVDTLPQLAWTMAGVRHGASTPTVFLALSGTHDGRLVAHNEYRYDSRDTGQQKTMKDYSDDFRAWRSHLPRPAEKAYIDPQANALLIQMWRDQNRGVHPAEADTWRDGIMETQALIGAGKLLLHRPTTEAGWEEMASYAWDPKASERGDDVPLRQMDHFPDTLRFAVRGSRGRWKGMLQTLGPAGR